MFSLLPPLLQNDTFSAEQCVRLFIVNMKNFCVNLVMLQMQEDRILLINVNIFLYFNENGLVYDVCVQVRTF